MLYLCRITPTKSWSAIRFSVQKFFQPFKVGDAAQIGRKNQYRLIKSSTNHIFLQLILYSGFTNCYQIIGQGHSETIIRIKCSNSCAIAHVLAGTNFCKDIELCLKNL